jgi:hypothetical protein
MVGLKLGGARDDRRDVGRAGLVARHCRSVEGGLLARWLEATMYFELDPHPN